MIRLTLISVGMIGITLVGDYLVKMASLGRIIVEWQRLGLAAILYSLTAIGLVYMYRHTKFFTVEAITAICGMILSLIISQYIFKEKISNLELLGAFLGVSSLCLMIKGSYR
jgi:drug/metabolite transporter (DMT)-like permease